MKKHFYLFTLFVSIIFLLTSSTSDDTIKGEVVYDARSDYHIIETNRFYVLVEWYSGPDLSKGDIVKGDLHAYGFKYVNVNNKSDKTKIYIENYWGNIDKCYEWLRDHGKMK